MLLEKLRSTVPAAAGELNTGPPDSCLEHILFFSVSRRAHVCGHADKQISYQHAACIDAGMSIRNALLIPVYVCVQRALGTSV